MELFHQTEHFIKVFNLFLNEALAAKHYSLIANGFTLPANSMVALLYLGTLMLMYAFRVSKEEEMMISRFGVTYYQYIQKTGRIFPRLKA